MCHSLNMKYPQRLMYWRLFLLYRGKAQRGNWIMTVLTSWVAQSTAARATRRCGPVEEAGPWGHDLAGSIKVPVLSSVSHFASWMPWVSSFTLPHDPSPWCSASTTAPETMEPGWKPLKLWAKITYVVFFQVNFLKYFATPV